MEGHREQIADARVFSADCAYVDDTSVFDENYRMPEHCREWLMSSSCISLGGCCCCCCRFYTGDVDVGGNAFGWHHPDNLSESNSSRCWWLFLVLSFASSIFRRLLFLADFVLSGLQYSNFLRPHLIVTSLKLFLQGAKLLENENQVYSFWNYYSHTNKNNLQKLSMSKNVRAVCS